MQFESVILEYTKEPLKRGDKSLHCVCVCVCMGCSYLCKQTWIWDVEGADGSIHSCMSWVSTDWPVFGTKHICYNFRVIFENLKLNIHIIAFNLYSSVVFQKKEESPFYLVTQSPNIFWVPSVCKTQNWM